jgi:uncharacterized DUF497 family protein
MKFAFDPAKSKANAAKHGIDFVAAQELWRDENRGVLPSANRSEPRFLLLAMREEKLWVAIYTMRGENMRLISVRRARESEQAVYEQSKEQNQDDGGES